MLDQFMATGRDQSNTTMGAVTVTMSNGVVLTGVWSGVSVSAEAMNGGEQRMANAGLCAVAGTGVDKTLIGKTCSYLGSTLRCANVTEDTIETIVYFVDETEALTL